MTMNDKKLYEEIENCLEYDDDIYGGDSVFLHTASIENLVDLFKNKETDLLEEFVDWYKSRLIHIKEHERELLITLEIEFPQLVECHKGRLDMVDKLISWLDSDLEKFLEERK